MAAGANEAENETEREIMGGKKRVNATNLETSQLTYPCENRKCKMVSPARWHVSSGTIKD